MQLDEENIYTIQETAKILNVSTSTLRSWDKDKYFVAGRTKGNHRRYTGKQIKELQQKMFNNESV
jgi:DNA-binding transcriptional MerR regulator